VISARVWPLGASGKVQHSRSFELIENLLGCSALAPCLASVDIAGGANKNCSFGLGAYLLEYKDSQT
jgi:hypothetical protein